ncbi:MAG: hypothetical protein HQL47_08970 [Gammaproteobacteria bacterium]|nr:hypothetical protein [Gammaproteobacteria bacterium]
MGADFYQEIFPHYKPAFVEKCYNILKELSENSEADQGFIVDSLLESHFEDGPGSLHEAAVTIMNAVIDWADVPMAHAYIGPEKMHCYVVYYVEVEDS